MSNSRLVESVSHERPRTELFPLPLIAHRYEEEIKRLRSLLEARGGAPSDAGPHPGAASPRLQAQGPPPIATSASKLTGPPAPLGAPPGAEGYSNGAGQYEREREAAARNGQGGPPHAFHSAADPSGSKQRSRLDGPGAGGAPPGQPGGYGPPSPGREQQGLKSERGDPNRRSGGYQGSAPNPQQQQPQSGGPPPPAGREPEPSPGPVAAGNNTLASWSDLDPDEVPKDLKKEGSDWLAIFNPKVKRTLDVNLVHTLMHESVVCCVRFSPDGKFLATGCNRSAQIYDTKTGAKVCILMDSAAANKGDLYIRSVCFSPDGKFLATGAEDRQVRVWDIAKKRVKNVFSGHKQEIYSLDWSKDGRIIASGSGDKTVRIWDVEGGQLLHTLYTSPGQEHGPSEAGVTSVSISSDNRLVAAGALDTLVRVWDTKTGQQLERLKSHKDSIYSVSFTPDGRNLVSGSLDKTLKMWDLTATHRALDQNLPEEERAGKAVCCTTFSGHKDYVLSVSTSPDGQWIASGSKDRGIQFWDPRTAQTQLILMGHKNSVIAISLSPAGGLLASGSGDFNARIWSYDRIAG